MPSILVYLPNISTDLLIEFMTASLGDIEPWVGFKKLGGKTQFRAPELSIELKDSSDQLYISVIQNLIATAKSLGRHAIYAGERRVLNATPTNRCGPTTHREFIDRF